MVTIILLPLQVELVTVRRFSLAFYSINVIAIIPRLLIIYLHNVDGVQTSLILFPKNFSSPNYSPSLPKLMLTSVALQAPMVQT
jgi:hypothetical protein